VPPSTTDTALPTIRQDNGEGRRLIWTCSQCRRTPAPATRTSHPDNTFIPDDASPALIPSRSDAQQTLAAASRPGRLSCGSRSTPNSTRPRRYSRTHRRRFPGGGRYPGPRRCQLGPAAHCQEPIAVNCIPARFRGSRTHRCLPCRTGKTIMAWAAGAAIRPRSSIGLRWGNQSAGNQP
jgi:hypothetical protein